MKNYTWKFYPDLQIFKISLIFFQGRGFPEGIFRDENGHNCTDEEGLKTYLESANSFPIKLSLPN